MNKTICMMLLGCAAMLTSCVKDVRMEDGHEAAYLQLPSGTLWATCNVGADKPSEEGNAYAWGEVETKNAYEYSWEDYKFYAPPGPDDNHMMLTKYCRSSAFGNTDGKIELDLEDDVANVEWGGNWRIPTPAQFEELANECTWKPDTMDGVDGYTVTGKNGQSIFLPLAPMFNAESVFGKMPAAEGTCYWLNSLQYVESLNSDRAAQMKLGEQPSIVYAHRCKGVSVRPVWVPKK